MAKHKLVTQSGYDYVKQLAESGRNNAEITKITNRSASTVGYILRSNDLEDYKRIGRERSIKFREKRMADAEEQIVTSPNILPSNLQEDSEIDKTLEGALISLDNSFENLKKTMSEVISLAVKIKTRDELEAKQEEIDDLRRELAASKTVVDAARQSSLVETIKNALGK